MARKSRKQPYRNALLKIEKERASIELLQKENLRLNANLLYKQQEAKESLQEAIIEKEKASEISEMARNELREANPYHPSFLTEHHTDIVDLEYAFNYRMSAPNMIWDDGNKQGIIRITGGNGQKKETVAYGFSRAFIENANPHDKELIEHIGKQIAGELTHMLFSNMKEW